MRPNASRHTLRGTRRRQRSRWARLWAGFGSLDWGAHVGAVRRLHGGVHQRGGRPSACGNHRYEASERPGNPCAACLGSSRRLCYVRLERSALGQRGCCDGGAPQAGNRALHAWGRWAARDTTSVGKRRAVRWRLREAAGSLIDDTSRLTSRSRGEGSARGVRPSGSLRGRERAWSQATDRTPKVWFEDAENSCCNPKEQCRAILARSASSMAQSVSSRRLSCRSGEWREPNKNRGTSHTHLGGRHLRCRSKWAIATRFEGGTGGAERYGTGDVTLHNGMSAVALLKVEWLTHLPHIVERALACAWRG